MSFSVDTKNELARLEQDKKCCMLAEIAGFVRMCGSIRLAGGGKFTIIISTENPAVARHFKKMIKDYFDVDANLEIGQGTTLKKGHIYLLTIGPEERSEQILRETGILMVREGMNFISDGIYEGLIKTKCCRKSYLRGVFLGAGTISDPEKGYHIEFVCSTQTLSNDVKKLINSFVGLHAKQVQRKKSYVVYVKESEQIVDILNILKAHGQLLKFEDTRILKEMRNKTNRINNCDNANLDKTLNASQKQLEAIRWIDKKRGLDFLNDKLKEVALLRLDNPDATLQELADMMEPPLKKSGINHRLKKIEEIAEKLV
ncbi:MAG: DNA-binding protein WhiA [Clostridiales bacterium]|uniref:DNA-binding protein WhiA n=1 Tax=Aminipila sp. TaxID=2060095 RepID=UPI001D8368AB|nr:DNA-binding protein WhiA [Aminipila sp.]MBE6034271.1 DNA-binding protein WhiA [Clostridiales bacterium]